MPFTKDHPYYPPKNGQRAGTAAATVRRRVTLAEYLNGAITEEEIFWWLREVAAGRDPDAERDEDGNLKGLHNPPDWTARQKAFAMILERRNGRPAQHVHLQQELRAAIGVAQVSLTPERLAALPRNDKDQLRDLLRKVVAPKAIAAAVDAGRDAAVQAAIETAREAEEDDE